MASPCEVLVESEFETQAHELCTLAQQEAMRIEQKFSRYRDDNIVHRINNGRGVTLQVDAETARLLDFAQHCYSLSDGYFDITSGILRRASQLANKKPVSAAAAQANARSRAGSGSHSRGK